jgi:hypothetical protein
MLKSVNYTAKFYEMRDKFTIIQKSLHHAQAQLLAVQAERNELYQKKKSFVSFEGFMTMMSLMWVVTNSTYSAIRGGDRKRVR